MDIILQDVGRFWEIIGSVWDDLPVEDKTLMEEVWASYTSIFAELHKQTAYISNSVSLDTIDPIWSYSGITFNVVYSVTDTDKYGDLVNVYLNASGLMEYAFTDTVLHIEKLTNFYWKDVNNQWVAQVLTSGINYYHRKYFAMEFPANSALRPTSNANFPGIVSYKLIADRVDIVNPILFSLWGRHFNINYDSFTNGVYKHWGLYDPSISGMVAPYEACVESLNHYKQIISALHYWSMQPPSKDVMRNITGIALGLPFAYEAGTVSVNIPFARCTITRADGTTQIIYFKNPSAATHFLGSTSHVDKYELVLIDGTSSYTVVDYISNSGIINTIVPPGSANSIKRYTTLLFYANPQLFTRLAPTYNQEVFDYVLDRFTPKGNYIVQQNIPPGITISG